VTCHRLDDQGLTSSSGRDFSLCHHIMTASEIYSISYPMDKGDLSLEVKFFRHLINHRGRVICPSPLV